MEKKEYTSPECKIVEIRPYGYLASPSGPVFDPTEEEYEGPEGGW